MIPNILRGGHQLVAFCFLGLLLPKLGQTLVEFAAADVNFVQAAGISVDFDRSTGFADEGRGRSVRVEDRQQAGFRQFFLQLKLSAADDNGIGLGKVASLGVKIAFGLVEVL